MDLKGKNVLVCGMAKSGVSAAFLAKNKGAKVILQDIKEKEKLGDIAYIEEKGIEIYAGANPDKIIENMDLVVVSPGIPTSLSFFQVAKNAGVKIISEVEFSYYYTPCPVIAITGTNGKTTTTALTGEIIGRKYPKSVVVGNIGVPFSGQVESLSKDDYVVAEISSFQMEMAENFCGHISAVLNITPDHLDRHKTIECYTQMKEKVFVNQTEKDFLVLNYNDVATKAMANKTRGKVLFFSSTQVLDQGIYLENGNIMVRWEGLNEVLLPVGRLKVLGIHNYENVMAATAIGICAGVSLEDIRNALVEFKGVEHRIEFVETVDGVDYYNDSKGTNVDAAVRGILAMEKPCVLIGGGYDKGADYSPWVKAFKGRVKHLVLIGVTAEAIEKCCHTHGFIDVTKAETFKEAMDICHNKATSGDCVLLSPACASWGMFDNYEERGNVFKEIVLGYKK